MPQSMLRKSRSDLVSWTQRKSERHMAFAVGTDVDGEFIICSVPRKGFVEVLNLWVNWGVNQIASNGTDISVWIAEGPSDDVTGTLVSTEETLDLKALWMDFQSWHVFDSAGAGDVPIPIQTMTGGEYIDFDPDISLARLDAGSEAISLNFYAHTDIATLANLLFIVHTRTTIVQIAIPDDLSEIDVGSPWEEFAQALM